MTFTCPPPHGLRKTAQPSGQRQFIGCCCRNKTKVYTVSLIWLSERDFCPRPDMKSQISSAVDSFCCIKSTNVPLQFILELFWGQVEEEPCPCELLCRLLPCKLLFLNLYFLSHEIIPDISVPFGFMSTSVHWGRRLQRGQRRGTGDAVHGQIRLFVLLRAVCTKFMSTVYHLIYF